MKTYEITSEVRGTEQFLVVHQEQEECLNDYLAKMLEYNSIPGILPLKSRSMNGRVLLNFQVGDRYRLLDLIRQDRITSAQAGLIYRRLTDAIAGMGEYFLNADQCLYDLEYLYVDFTLNPYLVYLPYENVHSREINKIWREFFLDLLSYFSDGKQDPFYDKLMRYLIQPNFNLKEFQAMLTQPQESSNQALMSVQEQMDFHGPSRETYGSGSVSGFGSGPVSGSGSNESAGFGAAKPQAVPAAAAPVEVSGQGKGGIRIPGLGEKAPIGKKESGGKKEPAGKIPEPAVPAPAPAEGEKGGRRGIAIPGVPGMNAAGSQKDAAASQEKPGKEKKQSSFFGFGKKKGDHGQEQPVPAVAPVQPPVSPNPAPAPAPKGEEWSKTMMIRPEKEQRTVMLNTAQPHLMHGTDYVPMCQFPFTVGKGNATYVVANQTVSRVHATILQQGNGYWVKDENSTNGTFLNGRRLEAGKPEELQEGDHLRMSNEEFVFHTS